MPTYDPAFRAECDNSVADYDYESGIQLQRSDSLPEPVVAAIEPSAKKRTSFRFIPVAASVLVIVVIGAFMVINHGSSEPVNDYVATPVWQDSNTPPSIFETPEIAPPGPPHDPGPPALSPAPQTRCDTRVNMPSYQAVPVEGPFLIPPGFVWIAGPDGRPPRFVLPELVNQWWNWRLIPYTNGCHDYIMEPFRLR